MTSEAHTTIGCFANEYTSASRPRIRGPFGPDALKVDKFNEPGDHKATGLIWFFNLGDSCNFGIPSASHFADVLRKR